MRLTDPTRSLPCPLLPFTCPFTALYPVSIRMGSGSRNELVGIDWGTDCLATYHKENYGTHAAAALTCHNR